MWVRPRRCRGPAPPSWACSACDLQRAWAPCLAAAPRAWARALCAACCRRSQRLAPALGPLQLRQLAIVLRQRVQHNGTVCERADANGLGDLVVANDNTVGAVDAMHVLGQDVGGDGGHVHLLFQARHQFVDVAADAG